MTVETLLKFKKIYEDRNDEEGLARVKIALANKGIKMEDIEAPKETETVEEVKTEETVEDSTVEETPRRSKKKR